ncbi:unnamed protein product [Meloidogyne enterolobii]|uniref:Uncharacterized protein n=1 Tax=Meloidogyne enterolobii TaxID=390850 RepID=A0ACB1AD90_MELEN
MDRFYKNKLINASQKMRSDNNTGYEASGSELLENSFSSTIRNELENNSGDSKQNYFNGESASSWGNRMRDKHLKTLNSHLHNNSFSRGEFGSSQNSLNSLYRTKMFCENDDSELRNFTEMMKESFRQNRLREEQIAREIKASNERKRKLELDSFEDIQDEMNIADFFSCSTNDNNRKTSEKKYKRQKMGVVIINKGGVIQFGNDKSRKNKCADSSSSSSSSSPEKEVKKELKEQKKSINKLVEMMEQMQKQVQALSMSSKNNG